MANLPRTQHAVQLVGPDEVIFNQSKAVHKPGRRQILCRIEAVGLCFSDLKLLKQFSSHARKTKIISGIDPEVLKEIPSYVPGDAPTVPGHEAVVRTVAVGGEVEKFKAGERYLVQTDYRWLPTAGSNGSFGYNFEGALQEYVLMDERVITSPAGDSMLVPVTEELSASAAALIEPWACVEDAYTCRQRQTLKPGGRMLVVTDVEIGWHELTNLFDRFGRSGRITEVSDVSTLGDGVYDDIVYFGSDAGKVEVLFGKLAAGGLLNIALCSGKFGRDVVIPVGRIHYGGIRVVGTCGKNPAESMDSVPETGEISTGDKINIVGAAGPMGAMNVVRNICQGVEGISIFAGDMDENRLALLSQKAEAIAKKNHVRYSAYNPGKEEIPGGFDYTVLMVPEAELVAGAVKSSASGGIINIFAGIPATVSAGIDMDAYIEKGLYFIGTSGSVLEDMKQVLTKIESGRLDTDVSVAAICGLEGAAEGIKALENRTIAGKIVVYPACKGLGLTELGQLGADLSAVAECLRGGMWNKKAEEALLASYS
jgi:threonine dehydrogenase-like Zn-dependent dehydrogenase